MEDVPCMDYPWDSWWDCPDDRQTKVHKKRVPKICYIAHFWESHDSCAMPRIPTRQLLGLSWQCTGHITHGMILHEKLSHA